MSFPAFTYSLTWVEDTGKEGMSSSRPVSYTHLDVYKRQELILADEPTGALDSRSAGQIMDIFSHINQDGQTVLMVTHSIQAACRAGRVLFIRDGAVYHQLYREGRGDGEMYRLISDTLTRLTAGGEKRA